MAKASGTFDDGKIGYDNNADDDIDDAGDDLVYNEAYTVSSVSPTYDNNGNLTEDAWYKYTYDAWNRLVKVTTRQDALTIGEYKYGPTGRRIKKVVSNSGDRDGTAYYYYAGPQMIEQRDGSENVERQFVFGTQYIDEPVAMIDDPDGTPSWYFHHQDANYNVVALTDSSGDVYEQYQYTPYGRLAVFDEDFHPLAEPAVGNPFTYTGRFHDVETGLYYYRARHYQPSLGRFVQRDPAGQVDGANPYQYGAGNPVARLDPRGLCVACGALNVPEYLCYRFIPPFATKGVMRMSRYEACDLMSHTPHVQSKLETSAADTLATDGPGCGQTTSTSVCIPPSTGVATIWEFRWRFSIQQFTYSGLGVCRLTKTCGECCDNGDRKYTLTTVCTFQLNGRDTYNFDTFPLKQTIGKVGWDYDIFWASDHKVTCEREKTCHGSTPVKCRVSNC